MGKPIMENFDIWNIIVQLCMNKIEDIDVVYQLDLIQMVLNLREKRNV